MTGFREVNKSAQHIRKINARKGKELCKLEDNVGRGTNGYEMGKESI